MDIMELGAIGELVGGVAVIASLLYVGLQVRQSTLVMRSQAISSRTSGQATAEIALMGNDAAEALAKSWERPGELSVAEMIRIENLLTSVLLALIAGFEAYELGLSSRREWEAARDMVPGYLSFHFARAWWRETKSLFPGSFVAELDEVLQNEAPNNVPQRFERIRTTAQKMAEA